MDGILYDTNILRICYTLISNILAADALCLQNSIVFANHLLFIKIALESLFLRSYLLRYNSKIIKTYYITSNHHRHLGMHFQSVLVDNFSKKVIHSETISAIKIESLLWKLHLIWEKCVMNDPLYFFALAIYLY